MHQVEVQVLELELLEAVVQRSLDVFGLVLGVPELGGDEDVLTLQAWHLGESLLDAFGNFLLVSVPDRA